MSDIKKKYELEKFKHTLSILIIEQERNHKLLQNYENRHIPKHAEFVKKTHREINLRDRRIRRLKEQIEALET